MYSMQASHLQVHQERVSPTYVKGASKEENQRYGEFLTYMEEKREEARCLLEEDNERKRRAKEKERSWELLKTSIKFLEENAAGWRMRRLKEVDRVKEQEKEDRKAIIKVKKKRYGIGKLSKEENTRLSMRSEERILIARGKENLWKKFQDDRSQECSMEEEEAGVWEVKRVA